MSHARVRKGLRGQPAIVREQFRKPTAYAAGIKQLQVQADDSKFRQEALALAKIALGNSLLWLRKKETACALAYAQRAVKLLDISR